MSSQQTIVQSAREGKPLLVSKGKVANSASDFTAATNYAASANMPLSNPSSKAAKIGSTEPEPQKPTAWVDAEPDVAASAHVPGSRKQPAGKAPQGSNGSATTNDSGEPNPSIAVVKASQSAPAAPKGPENLPKGTNRTAQRRDEQRSAFTDVLGKCSSPETHDHRSGSAGSGGQIAEEVSLQPESRTFKKQASKAVRQHAIVTKRGASDRLDVDAFQPPLAAKRRLAELSVTSSAKLGSAVIEESPGTRNKSPLLGSGLVGGNNKEALPARTFDENREDEIIALIEDHQRERLRLDPLRELDEALMDRTTASLNRRLKETYKHQIGRHSEEPLSPTFIEIDLLRDPAVRVISQAEAERHQELANRTQTTSDFAAAVDLDQATVGKAAAKQPRQQESSASKQKRLKKQDEPRYRHDAREAICPMNGDGSHRAGPEPPEFGQPDARQRYELEEGARRKSQRVRRPLSFRQFDAPAFEEQGSQSDRQVTHQYAQDLPTGAEHRHGTRSKTRLGRAFEADGSANSNSAAGRASEYFQTSLDKASIKLPKQKRAVNQSQADEQCNASSKVPGGRSSPDDSEGMQVDTTARDPHGTSGHIDDAGSGAEHFNGVVTSGQYGRGGSSGPAHMSASDGSQGPKSYGLDARRRKRWLKADQKGRGDLVAGMRSNDHNINAAWGQASNELGREVKKNKQGRFQFAQCPGGGHANNDLQTAYPNRPAAGARVATVEEGAYPAPGAHAAAQDLEPCSQEVQDDRTVNRIQAANRRNPHQSDAENCRPNKIRGSRVLRGSLPHYADGEMSDSDGASSGVEALRKSGQYREQISQQDKSLQQPFIGDTRLHGNNHAGKGKSPKRSNAQYEAGSQASDRFGANKQFGAAQGHYQLGDTSKNLQQINPINRYSAVDSPKANASAAFSKPLSRQMVELHNFAQMRSTADMHVLGGQLLRVLPPPLEPITLGKMSPQRTQRHTYSFGQTLRRLFSLTNMISVHNQPQMPVNVPFYPMPYMQQPSQQEQTSSEQSATPEKPAPKQSFKQLLRNALGPLESEVNSSPFQKGNCDSQGFARPENVIRPLITANQEQIQAKWS